MNWRRLADDLMLAVSLVVIGQAIAQGEAATRHPKQNETQILQSLYRVRPAPVKVRTIHRAALPGYILAALEIKQGAIQE